MKVSFIHMKREMPIHFPFICETKVVFASVFFFWNVIQTLSFTTPVHDIGKVLLEKGSTKRGGYPPET